MTKKKVFLSVIGIFILFTSFLYISKNRFCYKSALNSIIKTNNIEFIEIVHLNKQLDIAIYKNLDNETYGLVEFYNYLNILYRPGSVIQGYTEQKVAPFLVVSYYKENKYIVFIKTNDPKIKYVSIGTEKHIFYNEEYESYNISLNEVKSKPEVYRIEKLENGSACFVGEVDKYEKFIDNNMIMGFDEEGDLIADRRGEKYGRYLKR